MEYVRCTAESLIWIRFGKLGERLTTTQTGIVTAASFRI
jgi:hypothetical protein